jgi:hypothetical protein
VPDTLILPLANALLTCLETTAGANPDPPAEFCLRAGPSVIHDVDAQASLDKTCCPGLGYVRVGRIYPSTAFPDPDPLSDRCLSLSRSLELTMGIVRCVPNIGTPEGPSCADWTAAAVHDADDIDALWNAVCCWVLTPQFKTIRSRPFSIVDCDVIQEGDCIERFMKLLVMLPKCC